MPQPKAQLPHSDTFLINRLPDEILTMIFLLIGPCSLKNPHLYLPLSWVCRRWRSIVLGTSKFWGVITHKCHSREARDFTRDAILRSQSREVDVALCSQDCDDRPYITSCLLPRKRFEIRTLSLEDHSDFDFETQNLTQLENLIISSVSIYDRNQQSLDKFLSVVNPRFIELPASLLYKQISQSLNRLEWLKLDVSYFPHYNDFNLSIVYHVLETLPSLRVLNLISGQYDYFDYPHPAITLPNLRMFSLDPGTGGFRSIRTPALSYLGVSSCTSRIYNWDHLNGIDLSTVKSFRIALCYCEYEPFYWLPDVACISTGHSEEDCEFVNNFHAPVSASNRAMDHHWTLPPTSSFHLSFQWSGFDHRKLYSHLKRATSLVELIVDYRSIKSDDWKHWNSQKNFQKNYQKKYQNFLGEALNSFDTVTHLTVLRCRSFVSACGLLMDGRRLPHLEQLSYDSSFNPTCGPGIVFTYMAKVQDARIEACTKPLEILELKNFLDIPREEVEKIGKLEIQLIQINPRVANPPIMQ